MKNTSRRLSYILRHNPDKLSIVLDPTTYYYGTQFENIKGIEEFGLVAFARMSVHLSKDVQTAIDVGGKRGQTIVVFEIDGKQMAKDGYPIYESNNGVILTDFVLPKYITEYNPT